MDRTEFKPEKWPERYGDLLFNYALPRVMDSNTAQDLVQETFLSALKAAEKFRGEASEKTWLFAILKNKIIDLYRKKVVELKELDSSLPEHFREDGGWKESRRPLAWNTVANAAEEKEFLDIINWCKEQLRKLQQQVFTLKYLEDLDSETICKVLQISTSNYWILLHRARLQMRDCVEKKWLKP